MSLGVVLPVAFALTAILSFLVRLTVTSQRRRSVTGVSGMVGEVGRAITAVEPGKVGRVVTHGEIWRAIADEPAGEGEAVRVTAADGLTLTVQREAGQTPPAGADDPEIRRRT